MINKVLKTIAIYILLIFFMLVTTGKSADMKVKVTVDKAKIRLNPSAETAVIAEVALGTELDTLYVVK